MYRQTLEILNLLKRKRRFNYLQIGVSSRCSFKCKMCPRTCFSDRWKSTNMKLETYKRISRFFPLVKNVYLSGWGEPLLNPHFNEMVRLVKKAGCSVGFTTNGNLLNDKKIRDLVNDQVDLVGVSMAGTTEESHESKRVGSDFKVLKEKLALLHSIKVKSGSERPRVLILYMMFKDNLTELPSAIKLAADLKVEGIVATNIDYVGHVEQDKMKAFSCGDAPENSRLKILEAHKVAEELKVKFSVFPIEMNAVQVCSEDPINNLYISENGGVSPCVYLNLPIDEIPRIFCNRKITISPLIFGNINENTLTKIWENSDYISFRNHFERRKKDAYSAHLPDSCKTCYKAYGI